MLNQFRIKIHKLMMGKPKKKGFVNPYAQQTDKKIPVVKAKKSLSFPLVNECVQVVSSDIKKATTPAGKVGDMIREHNRNAELYYQFEELAYRGMK